MFWGDLVVILVGDWLVECSMLFCQRELAVSACDRVVV